MEVPTYKISQQLQINYPTALKAMDIIRYSMISTSSDVRELLSEKVDLDETYFGGRRKGRSGRGALHKVSVFGILERNGKVKVEVVKDVSVKSILEMTIKTVRRGSIVYTDKFRSYDALMFCGYRNLKVDHKKGFSSGKVYINGLEGFWSYAKQRLIKFHGVSKGKFPLYLKEMEFRYNHRNQDLFILLCKNLCNFVPELL